MPPGIVTSQKIENVNRSNGILTNPTIFKVKGILTNPTTELVGRTVAGLQCAREGQLLGDPRGW